MKNKLENFLQHNFVDIWHHILVMTNEAETKIREEAVELWFKLTKTGFKTHTVLTYSLISSLTSLSIETVRRHIKKLENNNWVSYSKKEGVTFRPSQENNKVLADIFNVYEVKHLGRFLDVIENQK